ncbi:abscisic acid 8'-hydroxylase 1-like [Iris pallida]|uniref:Abscisic acid 8'-hydroxylase 1-like n=1 Tax=Iris pallida TaxID=29817 RepID=A0AAX6I9G1_IRIPA|nr:abscisic acid 8'-hydroxylase 1-like [Iris pallida]
MDWTEYLDPEDKEEEEGLQREEFVFVPKMPPPRKRNIQSITVEQMEITKLKGSEDKSLSWDETKTMPFTCRVIQKTMRVASIVSFTFKEAVKNVEYQGHGSDGLYVVSP